MFQLQSSNPRLAHRIVTVLFLFSPVFFLFSCQKGAGTATEAKGRLLAVKSWEISEIYVDEVVRFKDGKLIPHFGGVDFGRYMEHAAFSSDGFFVGNFKGETVPLKLKYEVKLESIVLTDADPGVKSGEWVIVPSGVTEDSFEMSTSTKAYNYPSTTTIRLLFVADK